jgi:hypothetical protein
MEGFRRAQYTIAIGYFRKRCSRRCVGECYLATHAMTLTRRALSGAR